jgi:hypothetical protein
MEAVRTEVGFQIDNPVSKNFWTKYYRLHVNCWDKEIYYWEHNCGGTNTTKERTDTDSEAIFTAQPATEASTMTLFSWNNYQQKKLKKANAVN